MSAVAYSYTELAPKVEQALRSAFPTDTIETREGYLGRVHALVVSRRLNGMTERQKQDFLLDVLNAELGKEAEGVTVVLGYGTDEL